MNKDWQLASASQYYDHGMNCNEPSKRVSIEVKKLLEELGLGDKLKSCLEGPTPT